MPAPVVRARRGAVAFLAAGRCRPDRFVVAVAAVLAAPFLLVACGADSPDAAGSGPVDGAAVFEARCASCHGADLRGTTLGPSLLSIVYEPGHHPDDSFRAAISNGVQPHHWDFGPMPAVNGISDEEVEAVIAHVRAAQEREGFEPYPPAD